MSHLSIYSLPIHRCHHYRRHRRRRGRSVGRTLTTFELGSNYRRQFVPGAFLTLLKTATKPWTRGRVASTAATRARHSHCRPPPRRPHSRRLQFSSRLAVRRITGSFSQFVGGEREHLSSSVHRARRPRVGLLRFRNHPISSTSAPTTKLIKQCPVCKMSDTSVTRTNGEYFGVPRDNFTTN